jgi:hypothetical protein
MKFSYLQMTSWCLSALCTLAAPLRADDIRAGVPLPGLESDPAGTVVPQSCAVSVTDGQISVSLRVATAEPAPALLLNTPFFGWIATDPYPDRQFPELKILVDGVPITPEDRFEAFAHNFNITNLLGLAEMDPWAITHSPPLTAAHPQQPQVLKGLRNVGAIENAGDQYLAKWTARRLIRIPLKSVPSEQVELDYTARPATSVMTADQLDTTGREKSYCISPRSLQQVYRAGANATALAINEFTIATGVDGKPPASVLLTMSSGGARDSKSQDYLFLCGPHGKPIAKRGLVTHERAEVDDEGFLRVLIVTQSAVPTAR